VINQQDTPSFLPPRTPEITITHIDVSGLDGANAHQGAKSGLICFDLSTITRIFLAQARWLKAHPADYDGGSC
jgi:hypothetical protein